MILKNLIKIPSSVSRVTGIFLIIISLYLVVFSAEASTYYVSVSGDNSDPGTLANPWATPGYGSRQLSAGDTLIILGGIYSLSVFDADIITPATGSSGAWVTILGETGNRPVLACSNNLLMAVNLSGTDYIRIENLEITNDNGAAFRDGVSAMSGACSHFIFQDLYIHHLDEFGVNIRDINDLQILDCNIDYCGFGSVGGPEGVSGGWQNVLIENSSLSWGGHYFQGSSGPNPSYDRPDGFGIEPSSGPIEIRETTAEHNRGDGLDSKAENTYIHECTVANNSCDGVKLWGRGSKIENTLIYGRGDGNTTTTPWAAIVIDTDDSGADFEIINTTVDDSLGKNYLMYIQYDNPTTAIDLTVTNTIFSSRGYNAYIFLAASVNRTFEYNLFYFPNSTTVLQHGSTSYDSQQVGDIGSGNIYGDPLFLDPEFGAAGNYHLEDNSPALNAGSSSGAPDCDLEGNSRPRSIVFDMGCYEELFTIRAQIKVFLQGPYNEALNEMGTDLIVPVTSPYSGDVRTVNPVPVDIVDWVLIELRSTKQGAAMVSKSAFLYKDGRIVADDGTTSYIDMEVPAGEYYIVICHRNHLVVMSDVKVALSAGSSTLYDFTLGTDKYEGGEAALLEINVYGMYAGDGNESGIVTISDANLAITNRDAVGYEMSDYNLSGIVTISDANQAVTNRDMRTNVQ